MVKISLNLPVVLGGVSYKKGVQEVPKTAVTNNWFFDALVDAQHAVVLQTAEKVKAKLAPIAAKVGLSEGQGSEVQK